MGDTCTISGSVFATNPQVNGTWSVTAVWSGTYVTLSGPSGATAATATTIGTITCTHTTPPSTGTSVRSSTPYTLLYRPATTASNTPQFGAGGYYSMVYENTEVVGSTTTTVYTARAQRFFNGEVIRVQSDGQICGMTFPTAAERTNPPSFTVQQVNTGCGTDIPNATATFRWGGAFYIDQGSGSYCNGMVNRVQLVPCDLRAPAPTQLSTIAPWLANEFPLDATGMPDSAPINLLTNTATTGYTEAQDGTWNTLTYPPFQAGGVKGYGSTPIAASIADIDTLFTNLWTNGQAGATTMAGPPPYQISAISTHTNPKEKTILLFVTDGADTCAGTGDAAALTAANAAKNLYLPVVNSCKDAGDSLASTPPCADANNNGISGFTEPGSSVQTFMIGYGDGVNSVDDVNRLNWIAWGGSGVNKDFPSENQNNNATTNTRLKGYRDNCSTCKDAFIAPDAATLATQLQGIINQGAQDGDFNAQQSVTESVFEYVDTADATKYDARNAKLRYRALVPTKFTSSFSLPGFNGQLRAYQNSGGTAVQKWNAGDKLRTLVTNGMAACNTSANGGAATECTFAMLHGGATDATIRTSSAAIKRRVYTTTRNGVYTYTAANLIDDSWTPPQRTTLWPPASGVTPASFTTQGSLDQAFGLPLDTSAAPATDFATLQTTFKACLGSNLPAECSSATALVKMQAARREAREIMLAFMMGAEPIPNGSGWKRGSSGAPLNQILYRARSWVLADSELATVAVATPPLPALPKLYVDEYNLMTKGPRNAAGKNTDTAGLQLRQGFGLRTPDDDNTAGTGTLGIDTRAALKPVMTVIYAPANDMLHAFRAGPCYSPSTTPSTCLGGAAAESGGEELWGFVPYDMLSAIRLRAANQPQTRANHVYMLARGMRLTDVFVPGAMTNVSVGGITVPSMTGVWRRVLWFGRGIGGKYITSLDVTGVGSFTTAALNTRAPLPLWSRGNPDTQDGLAGGTLNNSTTDRDRYRKMGETWSIPVVGFVDSTNPLYVTPRRPAGVDFPLFVGSGYGDTSGCPSDPCEGQTFFTLDALSGDVIASVDVEAAAATYGLTRALSYKASLVANPAGFQPQIYQELVTVHPGSAFLTRVYIGDTHGRVWKFLTAAPNVAIPFADLGADQPVGTAAALIGLPPYIEGGTTNPVPYVHVTSGNDSRAAGPFKIFAFRDDGVDTDTATGTPTPENGVTAFRPAFSLYTRTFDQGTPDANCGYTTEAIFRGTVQPATTYERVGATPPGTLVGRVFYGGTRLSLPNSKFAPPTPLACGQGSYPCRSQFDSIVYALGTETGEAAYDLNAAGDDAYRVFRDSRLVAISLQADPDPGRGGSSVNLDEGLIKTVPKPPPPPGVPPTATTATANVVFKREPGQPAPTIHYGSTVCQ